MNERIKELYNQSGGLVRMYDGKLTYFPAYQKNVGDGNFEFSSFDPEKFAELIVRECYEECKGQILPEAMADSEGYTYNDGVMDCAIGLLQHFGVE